MLNQTCHPDLSRVCSVYFGGGTPSRLSLAELQYWIDWLNETIDFSARTQWSIEVNPEDLSAPYASGLLRLGFNRISIGVQSFRDDGLQTLGRQHTAQMAREAIRNAQKAGFTDINLDLMFGYPRQDLKGVQVDLAEMVRWNPTHVSVYCLNIEDKTPLARKMAWQKWQNDQEVVISDMYGWIVDYLADNGYRQYEVSNFSLKGQQSRQNLFNWNGREYLGLGMGAHSFIKKRRWGNHRRWVDYKADLQVDRLPQQFQETLTAIQEQDEKLMLSLRQNKGLNLAAFEKALNPALAGPWKKRIAELQESGLAIADRGRLRLTGSGMLLADAITTDLSALLDKN